MATVAVVSFCVLFTVTSWFGIVFWAFALGESAGGPLAIPSMAILALVGSTLACLFVFVPSTWLAQLLRRRRSWPLLSEVPLAAAGSVLAVFLLAWPVSGIGPALRFGLLAQLVLFAPLALYWWALQGSNALLRAVAWFARVGEARRLRPAGPRRLDSAA